MQLPSFVAAGSTRPVELARPERLAEPLAPYLSVEAVGGPSSVALTSGDDRLSVTYDGVGCSLSVAVGNKTSEHRSRRHGKSEGLVDRVAVTLTGTRLSALTREAGQWVVRGVVDLRDRLDTHGESWLSGVAAEGGELRGFGELGLRDLRVVTHADGSPYREGAEVLLTATSAGPGFFDTAHTSIWSLDSVTLALRHRSDVFFRRTAQPGVYGDHASHLLRDGDRWLLATSTWGDFDQRRAGAHVGATLAETTADLLAGRHVLDTRPLPLPTSGFTSVGVWDPHLIRTDEGWLVTYVSATKFFRFHPVLAAGPSLNDLSLCAVATGHRETEGVTLHRIDDAWHVLASDGARRRYPVLDLDLVEVGALDAPYPSNIPWPTLLEQDAGMLLIGFDGEPVGGRLVGYGSHGAVRFARSV
jgi:hypothetical protein